MTDQITIPKALLRRVSSELLYFYAQQTGNARHKHVAATHPCQIERLENVLREIDLILKRRGRG